MSEPYLGQIIMFGGAYAIQGIAGSFVSKLHDDGVSRAMVKSMVELARTLDIRVVAEQVEDREALAAVRELGVDFVQGFAIGRPRPLTVA